MVGVFLRLHGRYSTLQTSPSLLSVEKVLLAWELYRDLPMIVARLVIVMVRPGKQVQWNMVADPLQSITKRFPHLRIRILLAIILTMQS